MWVVGLEMYNNEFTFSPKKGKLMEGTKAGKDEIYITCCRFYLSPS